ncbi:MAG: GxxExxY protein [bacterium]
MIINTVILLKKIIGAAYKVYNTLGTGFLEKVYENALIVELKKQELEIRQQEPIKVFYEKEVVGDYIADIVVDGKVIVEIKAVGDLNEIHEVQLVNYLKATRIEIGLLINFGKKIEIKRKIFDQFFLDTDEY